MYIFVNNTNTCILIYVCMRGSMCLIPWLYGELTQVGIVLLELLVPSSSNATTESSSNGLHSLWIESKHCNRQKN